MWKSSVWKCVQFFLFLFIENTQSHENEIKFAQMLTDSLKSSHKKWGVDK